MMIMMVAIMMIMGAHYTHSRVVGDRHCCV
jgi:hypothetical protein